MKLKLKNKIQQAEQNSLTRNAQHTKNSSWEMSAQDALRIDYVTRNRSLPAHS